MVDDRIIHDRTNIIKIMYDCYILRRSHRLTYQHTVLILAILLELSSTQLIIATMQCDMK